MVNKDTFEVMSRQRKSSLPIVIPTNNKPPLYNNARNNTYDDQQNDGGKNLRNVTDNDVYYGDNDDDEDNYGDNDDFITFQAPSVDTSPVKHEPRYTRNLIQKNRKTSVIFSSKPCTYFNNVKKKKSSSGVSSSSSDNNFPLHTLSDRDEGAFEDDRKLSDISIDELSSSESSPSVSRRTSAKKLSETQREDLGYSSMREKTTPRNTSAYHLKLSNKLKESTSKKIGLWNEKINTQQKADSQNLSIYSLHGQKRRSKTSSSNIEKNVDEKSKTIGRRSTGTFVTNYEEKIKSEPKIKTHRSLSEKVSSFFGKKSQDQSNVLLKKSSSTLVVPEPEKVEEQVEAELPRSRKISQNLQITTQQITQLRKYSECSRSSKDDERKLSFADIQRKFSSTFTPQSRQRVNLVDQSTQTDVNNRLMVHFITNNPELSDSPFSSAHRTTSPTLKTRRRSLPVAMGYKQRLSSDSEGFSPFEPYSTITEFEEQPATRSKSACRCNFEPDSENIFIEQIRRQHTNPSSPRTKQEERGVKQTVFEEDCMEFDDFPMVSEEGEETFDYFDHENDSRDISDEPVSLPSWQKQSLAALATVEKTRRFSFNPPPPPTKKPLRRNKSHDDKRKRSISHNLLNPPWYQNEMPITPDFRINALSTNQSVEETSQTQSMSESFEDQSARVSVIHRPDLSQIEFKNIDLNFPRNLEKKSFHTLEDLKNENVMLSNKVRLSVTKYSDYNTNEDDNDDHLKDQYEEAVDDELRNEEPKPMLKFKITEPQPTGNQRRRKFGVMHLHALDSLPQRRRSVCQRDMSQELSNSLDLEPTSNSFGRKMSTAFGSIAHPFLQFDKSDDIEIVSDQNTLNVIVDSYDALNMDIDIASGTSYITSVPQDLDKNTSSTIVLFHRNHLDNLDEEEQESTAIAADSPQMSEDFENAVGFLERKKREMLRPSTKNVDSPISRGKVFDQEEPKASVEDDTDGGVSTQNGGGSTYTSYSTMFGYFNHFLYIFITKEYDEDKWAEITKTLKLTKEQRNMFKHPKHVMFDDDVTKRVLVTSANILHVNLKLFLNKYGIKYYDYCSEKYGDILKSIATNLTDFINNMDDIRRHIHKIEKLPDGFPPSIHATNDKKGLSMYYQLGLENEHLEYFMMGFIKRAALVLFGIRSRVSLKQERSRADDYTIIEIKSITSLIKKPSLSKLKQMSNKCRDLILEPDLMDRIFPFHFIMNDQLEITQLGDSLNRLLEQYIPKHGHHVKTYFKLNEPAIEFSVPAIRNNLNSSIIVSLRTEFIEDGEDASSGLVLKGQISFLESSRSLWFIGSPKVDYLQHFNGQSNLYLSDIPLHDVTREVLLVGEQKHTVETLKTQLQIMTNRLKETSKELALGRINTESILDEMFPKDVADRLVRNQPVPTVTTESVTILFTDIVGFTAICEHCDPEEVTEMLNKLYIAFDYLCEKYQNYKVETIGDAYMAVGGLHQAESDHGRLVTAMGVEMVQKAKNVTIPRKKENIQIRVGIHSGSVVAGVVGTLMPRYCLFGKNVTLANKMESTSEAGKVHISPYTYLKIKHHQEFIFWQRPRNVMPSLVDVTDPAIKYVNSFFVGQRRPSVLASIPCPSVSKSKPYMKSQQADGQSLRRTAASSQRLSMTETSASASDNARFPEDLQIQIAALDKLENGKGLVFLDTN